MLCLCLCVCVCQEQAANVTSQRNGFQHMKSNKHSLTLYTHRMQMHTRIMVLYMLLSFDYQQLTLYTHRMHMHTRIMVLYMSLSFDYQQLMTFLREGKERVW